jgi:hypothetical protein
MSRKPVGCLLASGETKRKQLTQSMKKKMGLLMKLKKKGGSNDFLEILSFMQIYKV